MREPKTKRSKSSTKKRTYHTRWNRIVIIPYNPQYKKCTVKNRAF